MKNKLKLKIFIFISILFLGEVKADANAVTVRSNEVVTGYTTIAVGKGYQVPSVMNGLLCNKRTVTKMGALWSCPRSMYFARTNVINGVYSGTVAYRCGGYSPFLAGCGEFVHKTASYSCTYTTGVRSWGACNSRGVQYPTGYYYGTVGGSSCADRAPNIRSCTPPRPPVVQVTANPSTSLAGTNIVFRGTSSDVNGDVMRGYLWRLDGNGTVNSGTLLDTKASSNQTQTYNSNSFASGTHKMTYCVFHGSAWTSWNDTSSVACANVNFIVRAVPTLNFIADPTTVVYGDTSTLSWSTTNATSCWASGDWASGWKAINSSGENQNNITANKTYKMECWNSFGDTTGVKSVTVNSLCTPDNTCSSHPVTWSGVCNGDCSSESIGAESGMCSNGCGGSGVKTRSCILECPTKVNVGNYKETSQ